MNLISSTLYHKVLAPKRKLTDRPPAIVLLHGRGADENDLLGLGDYFDERLMVISARAPFRFPSGAGYTWYDLEEVARPEPAMFAESFTKLNQFMEDVKKGYGINPASLVLCGFSMGSAMALALALTHPGVAMGVIANSGYIPEETDLSYRWADVKGKHFFIAHGTYDPVLPVAFAHRARELLLAAGAALTYREFDMGHQIGEESLGEMIKWLQARLDAKRTQASNHQ